MSWRKLIKKLRRLFWGKIAGKRFETRPTKSESLFQKLSWEEKRKDKKAWRIKLISQEKSKRTSSQTQVKITWT